MVSGGRSGAGLDAAGLVVLSLSIAGLKAPRFVDLQAEHLGHTVSNDAPILRGDLLFADGRVAIAVDDRTLITVSDTGVVRTGIDAFAPVAVRRRLP